MATNVLGVGGIFLRASDPKALYEWYEKHFGLVRQNGCFMFEDDMRPETKRGSLVLSFFAKDNKYFDPAQPAMLNLRVADLDATLAALTAAGVTVDPKRDDYDFGRFAWITDPEGNRVELWQPL
jgi:predicted enzyme related to lactoylglutathione lyase